MKKIDNLTLFSYFGISLVAFGWLVFFLAIFGQFKPLILIAGATLIILAFLYLSFIHLKKSRPTWDFALVAGLSLLAVLVFSHYTVPTVFTGRDQGSFSSAAITLAQNHRLKTSFPAEQAFFKIYGPGQALNFPGFFYTKTGELTPQFPIGYIAWLGAFYSFFGLSGLIVANALAFFLFLLSFYFVGRFYLKKEHSFLALLLVVTSFIFSWFFRFTLGENLAMALVWFGLFQFLFFWEERKKTGLAFFLLSFGLLFFVRIESVAFLAVVALIFYLKNKKHPTNLLKIIRRREIILVLSLILFALIASFSASWPFYKTFFKGFLDAFSPQDDAAASGGFRPFSGILYIFRVFSAYAMLTYIILGLAALVYFLKKKNYAKLLPFLILLPAFIYLLNPSISPDHPWMLRRYIFAVFPMAILYSVIFLKDFLHSSRFFYFFYFFLLLTNLLIFFPLFRLRENPTLLPQIETLSQNFQDKDLVLVDRYATGNPWAMMDGPLRLLLKKQAVYFFNPNDLGKLDLSKFDNVYFVVPDSDIETYRASGILDKVVTVRSYSLENLSLKETDESRADRYQNSVTIPPYLKNYTYGKIYLLIK